jgi:putative phosphotransacetylase
MNSKKENKISNGVKTVIAEISARHIHLSQADFVKLFGKDKSMLPERAISQPGQFAAKQIVTAQGPKKEFTLRIVGPARAKSQVELSITDCFTLGIKPVLQVSGKVSKASSLTIIGPKGKIKVSAIVAWRHLHISEIQAKAWGLKSGQSISASISGNRAVELKNIIVRIGPFTTRLHLDTDEGNAFGVSTGTKVKLFI